MGKVSVSLLGGFAASIDGVPVSEAAWRLKKARELVKLLALAAGHRLHREQVMDVLWRDRAPPAAANNLHQAVHVARRALGTGAIEVREEFLHLVADVDVDRLEAAAVDARRLGTPAAYRAALSLYAGELLPENRYDDWAEARRDDLAELTAALADAVDLGSADAARAPPLPVEPSSFVGRDRELGELKALLRGTRLLTLAGTGGVGKTRLVLVARDSAGYVLTGRDVLQEPGRRWNASREPFPLETSLPGVFAAGDVRHGSIKRVASAVGDGATAVRLVHEYLRDSTASLDEVQRVS